MASDWESVRLNDVAQATDYVANGSFASLKKNVQYRNSRDHAVLVRTVDFNNSWNGDYVWVDRAAYAFLRKSSLEVGDLVLSNVGSVGVVFRVPDLGQPMTLGPNSVLCRARDRNRLDQRFLYYFFTSNHGQQLLRSITSGSVQAKFNKTDFRAVELPLPPIAEQRAIARVLGSLDDKIELNRRMNETLEAIARALFKSWFVDFDPVRAKAEGRDPGLPAHLADLFPDSFEDSELGEIPVGWHTAAVSDLADVNARTLGRSDPLDAIDYVEISEVTRGQVANIVRYERGTEPSRARRHLTHGDTVLSTVRPDRGAYFLCLNPPKTLIASTAFAVVSPRDGNWAFLYSALTRSEVGDELGRLADGGAYPAVRPEAVEGLRLVDPQGSEIRSAFDELARPLYERSEQNRIENRLLTALRDSLLPGLISGELRVSAPQAGASPAVSWPSRCDV